MAIIASLKDVVKQQLQGGSLAASRKYRDSVRAIYGIGDDERPVHIGTCFLIEYSGGKYLVTAAHVADHASETPLFIGAHRKFVPLWGQFRCTDTLGKRREDDHYDYAWMELSDALLADLGTTSFISEKDISKNRVTPEGRVYVAMGFPCSKNKIDPRSKAVRPRFLRYYSTWKEMRELYDALGLTGQDHIAIDQNKQSRDDDGIMVNTVHPRGMSGGPLIDLGKMASKDALYREEVFPGLLAGLLIEKHDAHRALLAVKIDLVINAIAANP